MAHTKGPWHVGMKPGPMIYGPAGEQIADLRSSRDLLQMDEALSNMKLIQHAPELLEALQKASVLLSTYGSGDTKHTDSVTGDPLTPVMRQIMSAIEKATK